jgi:peptidoglycan/LPS O-acetylase OafA/YrhL
MNNSREDQERLARIPELDGLRGIAIGMVLIYHYFYLTIVTHAHSALYYILVPLRTTWTGVDLFFVLSGFLIGGILLKAKGATNYFRVFYLRRALRIVPLYTTFLSLSFITLGAIHLFESQRFVWMRANELPLLPYWVFLQNLWMVQRNTLGAFGLGVTWSLAVEEQFYLILPFIIHVLKKSRILTIVIIGILSAPALRTALHAAWPTQIYFSHVLLPCRADALLLGVLAAMAMQNPGAVNWIKEHKTFFSWSIGILGVGAAGLCKVSPSVTDALMLSVGYTWMALFYVVILLYGINWRQSYIGRLLRISALRWLGAIAYGAYLFHQLVLGLLFALFQGKAPEISTWFDLLLTFVALFATLVLCRISWVYFEKRLISIGHETDYEFGERVRLAETAEMG